MKETVVKKCLRCTSDVWVSFSRGDVVQILEFSPYSVAVLVKVWFGGCGVNPFTHTYDNNVYCFTDRDYWEVMSDEESMLYMMG